VAQSNYRGGQAQQGAGACANARQAAAGELRAGNCFKGNLSDPARWMVVFTYALAMAWVEAAVVYYLRTMLNRIDPHQANPLPIIGGLGPAELVREAATLLMLLMVGILAGRNWRSRLGYAAIAFGVWDIFYYVFLRQMCGWPHSLWDWDILFLLPLPWWGPVLAPVSIALLMILWGTLASRGVAAAGTQAWHWKSWALNLTGMALALYTFMADTLRVADQGLPVLRKVLPERFNWPLFALALVLMSAPVVRLCRELRPRQPVRCADLPASQENP
jgi:hypothetical protein